MNHNRKESSQMQCIFIHYSMHCDYSTGIYTYKNSTHIIHTLCQNKPQKYFHIFKYLSRVKDDKYYHPMTCHLVDIIRKLCKMTPTTNLFSIRFKKAKRLKVLHKHLSFGFRCTNVYPFVSSQLQV